MSVDTEFLSYPGLSWLSVSRDVYKFEVWVTVRFNDYTDAFIMSEDAIGENGSLLIKEAYLRRAKLIAVSQIAKELEK
jgi:hypothetical protein